METNVSGTSSFVHYYVLLSDVWASQCTACWQVIAFSQDCKELLAKELLAAETEHACMGKKPTVTISESAETEGTAAR